MKKLISLSLLALSVSAIASTIRSGSVEVKSSLAYVTMEAEVACVVRVHPRNNEEVEGAEIFFVNGADYAKYADLANKGYSRLSTLKGGKNCSGNTRTMPLVYVNVFDKSSEVRKEVLKQAASSKETVVFINYEKANNDFKAKSDELAKRLTR